MKQRRSQTCGKGWRSTWETGIRNGWPSSAPPAPPPSWRPWSRWEGPLGRGWLPLGPPPAPPCSAWATLCLFLLPSPLFLLWPKRLNVWSLGVNLLCFALLCLINTDNFNHQHPKSEEGKKKREKGKAKRKNS